MNRPIDAESAATILIVDDIPANLGVVVESLEEHGLRVVVAQDGEEGLQRAAFVRPDLILLDVMMPGLDGFETCRRLKADAVTSGIPVIFMTALADTDNKLAGFQAGGVDYVTKPLDTAEVRARVHTHLSLRAMQARLAAQNRSLAREVAERQAAEGALQLVNDSLRETNRRLATAQGQLLQAEKLAAIGQLAAGVAHEINNPISFVISNMACLGDYLRQLLALLAAYQSHAPALPSPAREAIAPLQRKFDDDGLTADLFTLLAESNEGLLRVKKIVQDLRDFSRVDRDTGWQATDLHEGLDSTLNVVAGELRAKATVVKAYGAMPEVECLAGEINQVFMNLLVNAAHAIRDRGEIRIATGCRGGEVWIEIADTGVGIPGEHLPRIFEPFFTTKPVGQGVGLGLSLAYAAVRKHNGRIEVDSTPGGGAVFRVWLPLRQPAANPPEDPAIVADTPGTRSAGASPP